VEPVSAAALALATGPLTAAHPALVVALSAAQAAAWLEARLLEE